MRVHLLQGEIIQLLKGCVRHAHRIRETDLSSQICLKSVCGRTGPRTQGWGEKKKKKHSTTCGRTQLLPVITGQKRSPIPTRGHPSVDKKAGRSYPKTYAFVSSMFCKISAVLLLLQTRVFLQWLRCIKRNPRVGFRVCTSSGKFSPQTDQSYKKVHRLCIYLTSKFHQDRRVSQNNLTSSDAV